MDEIEQIPIQIKVDFPIFVSAGNFSRIAALTEQAVFELELAELEYLRREFREIPESIYDAAILRLYRKSGNAFLIKEAHSGSIVLGGIAVGLAIWLLNQTIGETVKEAWLESESHTRMKDILLARFGGKKQALGEQIEKKLNENGVQTGIEVTEEAVSAYVSPQEDEELANELQEKPQFRTR